VLLINDSQKEGEVDLGWCINKKKKCGSVVSGYVWTPGVLLWIWHILFCKNLGHESSNSKFTHPGNADVTFQKTLWNGADFQDQICSTVSRSV